MTCEAPHHLTLFRPEGVIMLADVRTQVELMLAGNERRDTLSAFNVLAARGPVDLGATPATARACASSSTRLAGSARRERQALCQHPLARSFARSTASA